ncbi:MAG: alpha/beta fold hydrolase, partial [Candidatus Thiodiazotropha taylori]|nr:alpha/beta fold hydrolase [Candidatus Thiodiazotropha taylori]
MESLYSSSEAYAVHTLSVGPHHKLYIEESGTKQGIPVVFLHGGPGSGCNSVHRRFFDPDAYRVILFDQRGAGKSEPLGETA